MAVAADRDADAYVSAPGLLPGVVGSAVGYRVNPSPSAVHRGLPSPWLTVVISLDTAVVCGNTAKQAQSDSASRHLTLVGGLHAEPVFIAAGNQQAGVQLAVHPLAARALFGVPARELAPVLDADLVWGPAIEALRLRLLEADTWAVRFATVREALRARLDPPAGVRPEVGEAWRWLVQRRGSGGMDELARHVMLSGRQLRALFTREVGMGPKQVSRLIRFSHATQRITAAVATGGPPQLTGVAAACGYADHAHLDRDFARFAGTSPTGWLTEERRNIQARGHRQGAEWTHA